MLFLVSTKATTPPDRWTTAEPAKSWKPLTKHKTYLTVLQTVTRVSRVRQPAPAPGPVGVDGVDHARHQDAEQDVPVITGGTGDCTGGGTGCRTGCTR